MLWSPAATAGGFDSKEDSEDGFVVDGEANTNFLMSHNVRRILAVEGLDVLQDYLEGIFGCVHDDVSSRSTRSDRVHLDCCNPCKGLMLTHTELAKLGMPSPGAHTACSRYCSPWGLD